MCVFIVYLSLDAGILPEALRTKCARCSPQQQEGGLRVITKLYYDYPTQYNRLRAKWDPTGEYHRRFEEYLRGLQFNTINNEPVSRKLHLNSIRYILIGYSLMCILYLGFIAQPNSGATVSKTPSILASASSNSQNVISTAIPPASSVCAD